ncbi:uncharacterized protein I303_107684 [Kwoniella dejecticola CBS 10117]|uniref:Uncharacterized protein n=1 Tax=Kwoniella dejecticola CBS 10117 TaxID=1296121 RepID=A0A1A5ZVF3_9TREE|nr:uncharacterized protein I303_07693 [Kwoniella dejecticola CBS 10117]OBR81783.1 hypothetical protein I303_07693 [Kwoniella dejecticola CBS 10117]
MLLKLLPEATLANPSPLTILFTLPLPTHPYTSRSLPLPPSLLAHRALCLQEDIDCGNVLLGEKSSWICGIIDDVTFSLPTSSITVNFIDGSTTSLPVSLSCVAQLQRVVEEVQLSFTAPSTIPSSPRSSTSSIASTSSASSSHASSSTPRRTPSSLLLSLLSPLLPSSSSCAPSRPSLAAPPCAPARVHRRAARSLLVDTYRRYVLPLLKEQLPCSYFPWAITSETSRQLEDFAKVRDEINRIIDNCGISRDVLNQRVALQRTRSISSSSLDSLSADESDSESAPSPVTPATSIFSASACVTPSRRPAQAVTPQSFLLSIPPAHALPTQYRMAYASQLARLTQIASRVHQIKKLNVRYEREEGKRRWLEGLERGRLSDKSLRKAFLNAEYPMGSRVTIITAEVTKASRLWQSTTWGDIEREAEERLNNTHPAMMDISDNEETLESDDDDDDEEGPITPPKSRCNSSNDRPLLSLSTIVVDALPAQRPILERKLALITERTISTPGLIDTWETDEEDEDVIRTPVSLSPPNIAKKLIIEQFPSTPRKVSVGVEDELDRDGVEELEEVNEHWRIYA